MRAFSIVQPLYMAFYSKALYRDVARNWGHAVFVYLLVLLALCWIPAMGKIKSMLGTFMRYEMPKLVSQVPQIDIRGGQAVVHAEMPYTITEPDTGTPLAILDTTGQTTSLDDTEALFLLTKDKLITRTGEKDTSAHDLSAFEDITVDQQTINGWMGTFDRYFFMLMYPFALLVSYLLRLVQVLIYAAIGMMYDRSMKAGLGYVRLMRIAAIAITPAVILNTVRFSLGLDIPGWGFISFMLAMAYIFFGVMANVESRPAAGEGRE